MGFFQDWLDRLEYRSYERNSFRPGEDQIKLKKQHGEWWYWDRTNRRWVRWSWMLARLPRHQAAELRATLEEVLAESPDVEEIRVNVGSPV